MLIAITRKPSPALARCELEFLSRVEIDVAKAGEQHRLYEACLAELGARVISLDAEEQFPDSMFVEDPALVLDEIAIAHRLRPGAASRRGEERELGTRARTFSRIEMDRRAGARSKAAT